MNTDLADEAAEEILKELGADELYVINIVKWDVVDITEEDVSTTNTNSGEVVRCPLLYFFERQIGREEYWHYIGRIATIMEGTSNSKKVFLFSENSDWMKTVTDCLNCYKDECRNDHFHKDVMTDWRRVQLVRDNTLFLYIILLGGCRMSGSADRDMVALDVVPDFRLERMH